MLATQRAARQRGEVSRFMFSKLFTSTAFLGTLLVFLGGNGADEKQVSRPLESASGYKTGEKLLLFSAESLEEIKKYHTEVDRTLRQTFSSKGLGHNLFFVTLPYSGPNNMDIICYKQYTNQWRLHAVLIVRNYTNSDVTFKNRRDGVEIIQDNKSIAIIK